MTVLGGFLLILENVIQVHNATILNLPIARPPLKFYLHTDWRSVPTIEKPFRPRESLVVVEEVFKLPRMTRTRC